MLRFGALLATGLAVLVAGRYHYARGKQTLTGSVKCEQSEAG